MKDLLAGLLILAIGFSAQLWIVKSATAQANISVDIRKTAFTWNFAQGTGGAPTEFRIKCGAKSRQYTVVKVLSDTSLREYPILDVVPSAGRWFCAGTAVNQYGETQISNEAMFDAGDIPTPLTNFGIKIS
jgi:hypothetical protein